MGNVLTDLSTALSQTVTSAGAAVVRIEGRRRLAASGIVWTEDGVIFTAHHVVRRDEGIQVGLPDGRTLAASLIGRDPSTDLALLKVDASGLTPLTEANKQDVAVGHFALALARPGKTVQATFGIISAVGEGWHTPHGGQVDRYLQTDVVMYPGFSGGPLVNASGHLLGLNSSHLAHGVSVAIPTSTLARVADSLLAHGRIKRGYLGVSTQRARLPESLRDELGQRSALLIISVESDSPASKAGLAMGDTIVAVADTAVRSHEDLLTQLSSDRVGTAVPIKILRGGQLQTVAVTVGER